MVVTLANNDKQEFAILGNWIGISGSTRARASDSITCVASF